MHNIIYPFKDPNQKPPIGAQLNRSHPLAQGLVGCWLMNEGAGNIVRDYSGNNNHGTMNNFDNSITSGWAASSKGQALAFDGVNGSIPVSTTGFSSSSGTIAMLINAGSYLDNDTIPFCSVINSTNRIYIDMGTTHTTWDFNIPPNPLYTIGSSNVALNKWHHLVCMWNRTMMCCYLNGSIGKDGYKSVTINNNFWASTAYIGSYSPPAYFFHGLIASLSIYNRTLSELEVNQLYRNPYCIFEKSIDDLLSTCWDTHHVNSLTRRGVTDRVGSR